MNMCHAHRALIAAAGVAVALTLVAPAFAQSGQTPTTKDPVRFSAFAVQLDTGTTGVIEIAVERWSTDAEREELVGLAGTATEKHHGQEALLKALKDVEPRVGYIRTPNSLGWDLKYARQTMLADGTRQIVVVTDKPVSFAAALSDAESMDYPFSLIEMHFDKNSDKGEGKLMGRTAVSTKNGRLEIDLYGNEPTRLTSIKEKSK